MSEQFFPQPVFLLPFPFLGQEGLDGCVAAEEGGAVAPGGGGGVGAGYEGGGLRVPEGLGGFYFEVGGG